MASAVASRHMTHRAPTRRPLFADRECALVGAVTVAALVAMEGADAVTSKSVRDDVRDGGTARLFGVAMAVAIATAGGSVVRPGRRSLPRNHFSFWAGTTLT